MGNPKSIREPAVAGFFYPRDPVKLAADVDRMIAQVEPRTVSGRARVAVSPHAGYQYSGSVAAHCYRLFKEQEVHTAVVISPSHAEYFDHCSVFDGDGYETPLGVAETDKELAGRLAGAGGYVRLSDHGHLQSHLPRQEHALEVQIPFLQRSLGAFKLVPVVMGDQGWEHCVALGEALAPLLKDPGVIVVASTDLSHFYSAQKANGLDGEFIDRLAALDSRGLFQAVKEGNCEACGAGPVIAALIATDTAPDRNCTILKRANSGDVTGDFNSVVGYMSAVVTAST